MAAPRIVVVTGANSGIGYEVVKALLLSSKPYHTFVGARNLEKAEGTISSLKKECPDSTDTLEPLPVDLNSDESIEKAYDIVKSKTGKIDCLINNAGASFDLEHIHSDISLRESFTKAYNVNVAGTHVLTHTFAPLLLSSTSGDPRLIFVAGLANQTAAAEKYFPTPEWPKGWPKEKRPFETIGYRCSKTAMNMLMLDWNHKLKNDGVKVWAVSVLTTRKIASTRSFGITDEYRLDPVSTTLISAARMSLRLSKNPQDYNIPARERI